MESDHKQHQRRHEHDHQQMMQQRHQMTLWVHFAQIALGLFLATSPVTFGYDDQLMIWNDLICGVLIAVIGLLSISPERSMIRWANTAIGIWLLFAPLVVWSVDPEAYLVDTTVGPLVIAFSILVPGMPGMRMLAGPTMPPGWSYNPSSWLQRAPIITLGLVSFFIARYLAAYQLGYIDDVWDPVFGDATVRILDSDVSRAWPISDAVFDSTGWAADSNYLFGPLVVVVAVIAMAEVVRAFRFLNIAFGAWIAVAPFLLSVASTTATISNLVIGLALIALSLPRGPISQRYAGWRRYIR